MPELLMREALLRAVRENLNQYRHVALMGVGGLGKTWLARTLYLNPGKRYAYLFWINASEPAKIELSILQCLTNIASNARVQKSDPVLVNVLLSCFADLYEAGTPSEIEENRRRVNEKLVAEFRSLLARNQDWLLVFDNVNDVRDLDPYLQHRSNGEILLTMNSSEVGDFYPHSVEVLTPEEGAFLLLHEWHPSNRPHSPEEVDAAKAFTHDKLGGLPLAILQTAATLKSARNLSLDEYRQKIETYLKNAPIKMIGQHPEHSPVYATVAMALERIGNDPLAEQTKSLLKLCAFLDPEMLHKDLLSQANKTLTQNPHFPEAEINQALTYFMLEPNSLSEQADLFIMHRVVQIVLKAGMEPNDRRQWAERAAETVAAIWTAAAGYDRVTRQRLEWLYPQIESCAVMMREEKIQNQKISEVYIDWKKEEMHTYRIWDEIVHHPGYDTWFKLESEGLKQRVLVWVYHLEKSSRVRESRLTFAKVYFGAHYWWYMYIGEFNFCRALLDAWELSLKAVSPDASTSDDKALHEALVAFHDAYPSYRDYWTWRKRETFAANGAWRRVLEALYRVQALLDIGSQSSERDQEKHLEILSASAEQQASWADARYIRGITNVYLGQALSHFTDLTPAQSLEMQRRFSDAEQLHEARRDTVNSRWAKFYGAEAYALVGWNDLAYGKCHAALDSALNADIFDVKNPEEAHIDPEVTANAYRVLADMEWESASDEPARLEVIRKYCAGTFGAYLYQRFPYPVDGYTLAFHREFVLRTIEKIEAISRLDRDEALRACAYIRQFWQPYWQNAGTLVDFQTLVRGIRLHSDGSLEEDSVLNDLADALFPPAPDKSLVLEDKEVVKQSDYLKRVEQVALAMPQAITGLTAAERFEQAAQESAQAFQKADGINR